jgi:hypothetical protein
MDGSADGGRSRVRGATKSNPLQDKEIGAMNATRIRGITAYIGDFSSFTWTFSTSGEAQLQLRDVHNATAVATVSYARTGVDSRLPVQCPPASSLPALDAADELEGGLMVPGTSFLQ